MKQSEIKALAGEVAPVVRDLLSQATAPLMARIDALEKQLAEAPAPKDGKDADPEEVARIVAEDIRKDIDGLREAIEAMPEAPELPDIPALISEAVEAAIAEIPAPKDGKDGEKGDKGADGKDGAGIADLLIDREGNLTATFTDGRMKSLGVVVGKDGERGKDGADGLGFDDLSVLHDGERAFTLRFQKGAKIIEETLVIPAQIYRGVYSSEKDYQRGDCVTYGGSQWIALKDTNDRPDGGGDAWQLAVKRGRDGKDGVLKPAPEPQTVKVK